ncbi:F-box protein [Methylosinus sp. H3A]|uniref:F-box protein n=1 Tax=Methylosinus sp. H3A TaxID=2785786 RepID=UPI0018C309A7|nr:F-box protein [Methylosinus sp. H3A]MBG0808245.1 F-box protein [Methylosinus sp. H3A]
MERLPNELWTKIFTYLQDPNDLKAAILTCKTWRGLAEGAVYSYPHEFPQITRVKLLADITNASRVVNTLDAKINTHGQQAKNMKGLKDAVLCIKADLVGVIEARNRLPPLLAGWSEIIDELVKSCKELMKRLAMFRGAISAYLVRGPDDAAMQSTQLRLDCLIDKASLQFQNVDRFVIEPFNEIVKVCQIIGLLLQQKCKEKKPLMDRRAFMRLKIRDGDNWREVYSFYSKE